MQAIKGIVKNVKVLLLVVVKIEVRRAIFAEKGNNKNKLKDLPVEVFLVKAST